MTAKKVAGMKTGIEIRLLGWSFRGAPQIRQTVALRATRAPQVGQCLFSSAILARFRGQTFQVASIKGLSPWLGLQDSVEKRRAMG